MFDDPRTLDWDELYQNRPFDEMRFCQTALDHDLAAEFAREAEPDVVAERKNRCPSCDALVASMLVRH